MVEIGLEQSQVTRQNIMDSENIQNQFVDDISN